MYVCLTARKNIARQDDSLTNVNNLLKKYVQVECHVHMSSFPDNVAWKKAEREVNESIKKEFQIVFIMVNVICASVPFVFSLFFCNVTFVHKKYKNMLVHEKHIDDIKCILRNISIEARNLLDIDSI